MITIKAHIPLNCPPDLFNGLPGVTRSGGQIEFDAARYTNDQVKAIMDRAATDPEGLQSGGCKEYSPTETDLAIVREMAGGNVDGLFIFEFSAANSRTDYDGDRLTPAFLKEMANFANAQKISLMYGHAEIMGKVFSAEVVPSKDHAGHYELREKAYVMRDWTVPGQPAVKVMDAIKSGVLDYVSVRFKGPSEWKEEEGQYVRVFNPTGKDAVIHPETSIVWFGGQREARMAKKNFDYTVSPAKSATNTPNIRIMNIEWRGKTFDIKADGENLTGLDALKDFAEKAIKEAEDKAAAAIAMNENNRKALADRITTLQGKDALDVPVADQWDAAEMAHKSFDKLLAKATVMEAQFAAKSIGGQTAGAGAGNNQKNDHPYFG